MTVLDCLWPVHMFFAGLGLLACALRASGRATLPALTAVLAVTIAALGAHLYR